MGQVKINRACGTCRDRRIACDRGVPTCSQCMRSKRECQGYSLRLSWPTVTGDCRRAIVADIRPRSDRAALMKLRPGRLDLVRAGNHDVELHYRLLAASRSKAGARLLLYRRENWPVVPSPAKRPSQMQDWHLLSYFHEVASHTLSTFLSGPEHGLGGILTRIGFADDSPSSQAVLRALLALSSLQRHGPNERAMELKVSAIGALAAAAKIGPNTPAQVLQHVAAGMLLCSYEVNTASCTSEQWLVYISGIKRVLTSGLVEKAVAARDPDWLPLVGWMLYHDSLSRFTLRHWRRDGDAKVPLPLFFSFSQSLPEQEQLLREAAPWAVKPIEWQTEILDIVDKWPAYQRTMSTIERQAYKRRVRRIDEVIRQELVDPKCPATGTEIPPMSSPFIGCWPLYPLSLIIYLHRGTEGMAATCIEDDVSTAFSHLVSKSVCDRQFPLFIIGCEARTDEQRTAVLDLMARSEKLKSSRSVGHVRLLLEAAWAQDDLLAEGRKLDYILKLSGVINLAMIPPSFA
ncbi:uncharacterized protein PgNI_04410 [Pyricularia grisea]|uniref:Zn(2)-C6 fungal-type domain-containing protein n=1 Tax=Pyricularia grisea TaxID=148305 RepID=A0A6P8BEP5_PYRGI|nr:uncharacterized protein PgNI_04410 [Pyricularia grisea]TLD14260.1 hypothetical protein PgNI_04410 [Pyricularia grisea]